MQCSDRAGCGKSETVFASSQIVNLKGGDGVVLPPDDHTDDTACRRRSHTVANRPRGLNRPPLHEVDAVAPARAVVDGTERLQAGCKSLEFRQDGGTLESRPYHRNLFLCDGTVDRCALSHGMLVCCLTDRA